MNNSDSAAKPAEMSDEQVVKAVYPNASQWSFGTYHDMGPFYRVYDTPTVKRSSILLGYGWADARAKLPNLAKPAEMSDERRNVLWEAAAIAETMWREDDNRWNRCVRQYRDEIQRLVNSTPAKLPQPVQPADMLHLKPAVVTCDAHVVEGIFTSYEAALSWAKKHGMDERNIRGGVPFHDVTFPQPVQPPPFEAFPETNPSFYCGDKEAGVRCCCTIQCMGCARREPVAPIAAAEEVTLPELDKFVSGIVAEYRDTQKGFKDGTVGGIESLALLNLSSCLGEYIIKHWGAALTELLALKKGKR